MPWTVPALNVFQRDAQSPGSLDPRCNDPQQMRAAMLANERAKPKMTWTMRWIQMNWNWAVPRRSMFTDQRGFFGGGGSPPSPPPPPPPPPTLEDPAAQKARQDAAMRARMRMGRAATFLTQGGGSGLTGPAGGTQNPGLGGGGGTQNLGG